MGSLSRISAVCCNSTCSIIYLSMCLYTNYYSCGIMVQLGRDVGGNFNIHVLAFSSNCIVGGVWVPPTIWPICTKILHYYIIESRLGEACLMLYSNNRAADQPHCLIGAFHVSLSR